MMFCCLQGSFELNDGGFCHVSRKQQGTQIALQVHSQGQLVTCRVTGQCLKGSSVGDMDSEQS